MALPTPLNLPYTTTRSNTPITLDLYLPPGPSKALYINYHGGGLITGSRSSPLPTTLFSLLLSKNYAIISPDYRLLPEVTAKDIRSDVAELEKWVLAHASQHGLNTTRVAVGGHSAGAYVAMMSIDIWTVLQPKAFVNFYGMIDIEAAWYNEPKANGTKVLGGQLDLQELRTEWFENYWKSGNEEVFDDPVAFGELQSRFGFFLWALREGVMGEFVTGSWKEEKDVEWTDEVVPLRLVKKGYLSTIIVHGDRDSIVPIEGSYTLMETLEKHGVERELIVVEGMDHGLQPETPEVMEAHERVVSFLEEKFRP